MCCLEENYKLMQKIQILKIWEHPLYEITESMPVNTFWNVVHVK